MALRKRGGAKEDAVKEDAVEGESGESDDGRGSGESDEEVRDGEDEDDEAAEAEAEVVYVRPAAKVAGGCAAWWWNCALITFLGSYGALYALKNFFDPAFSDGVWSGPGSAILGDAGRLLRYEAGKYGIKSRLFGIEAWALEGAVFTLGTIGVALSWSPRYRLVEASAYLAGLEGIYLLLLAVYLYTTSAHRYATGGAAAAGGALVAACVYRFWTFMPRTMQKENNYDAYLTALAVLAVLCAGRVLDNADDKTIKEFSLKEFAHVRDYFLTENGRTWSTGRVYPDGYNPLWYY